MLKADVYLTTSLTFIHESHSLRQARPAPIKGTGQYVDLARILRKLLPHEFY